MIVYSILESFELENPNYKRVGADITLSALPKQGYMIPRFSDNLNKVYTFPSKRFLIKIYPFLCVSKCFCISKKIIEFLFALLICVRNQYLLSHLYLCRIFLEFLSLSGRVLKKSTLNLVKTSLD